MGNFVVKDTAFSILFKQPRRRSHPILLLRVTHIIKRPENGLAEPLVPHKTTTKKEYYYEKTSLDRIDGRRIGFRSRAAF
jgi:hypothetical protein